MRPSWTTAWACLGACWTYHHPPPPACSAILNGPQQPQSKSSSLRVPLQGNLYDGYARLYALTQTCIDYTVGLFRKPVGHIALHLVRAQQGDEAS